MIKKDEKLDQILSMVKDYIDEKKTYQKWTPGVDWVKYAGPVFDSEEFTRAVYSLMNEWLVLGNDAQRFEREFPKFVGKIHGVLTNSGSSANLLMMSALKSKRLYDLPPGSKIITPIAGFPTTINPIIQCGFEPVFIDIHLDSLNLDVEQLEEAAKNGAKALIFAHVLGNPPNMDKVMEIVKKYDLIFLEDTCDALGSTYDGKPLGSFGDMSSYSFYPAHHITMGEGGFVATKTHEQEVVVRSFREWGRGCYCVGQAANLLKDGTCKKRFDCWLPSLPNETFDHKYVYEEVGYNLKPIELQASMGLAQLKKLDMIGKRRRENYHLLKNVFEKYENFFHLPVATEKSDPSWFAFPLTVKDGAPFKRSALTNFLEMNKIQTRTYFAGNVMLQPAYSHMMNSSDAMKNYPVATKVTKDTFFLGTSPIISAEQIEYIEQVVQSFMKGI
jgi:CDP-6-deoxy-D-xylo-4-hexulose-3-dehydrase